MRKISKDVFLIAKMKVSLRCYANTKTLISTGFIGVGMGPVYRETFKSKEVLIASTQKWFDNQLNRLEKL